MKLNLITLLRFVKNFGIIKGLALFYKFIFGKLNNLKIPGIKSRLWLRSGTSDVNAFYQIIIRKEYDIPFISNPEIIIDGGANIGLFALVIKSKFPDARVISIEPDQENFKVLQKNLAGYSDVYCENYGLWNKETNLKVYDKFEMGKWAMVVEESEKEDGIKAVSINKVMEMFSLNRIDILKLDIETSEKVLFRNNYENWLSKTKMIIIELHDCMEEGCSKPFFEAINKTFKSYSYAVEGENTIIINNDLP
jgi:FkbM family methyltransferase